jgi:hypothetical protein
VTYTRSGRGQRPTGQRQQARPATPPAAEFTLLVGGLVQCAKCAALIPDTRPAREQHSSFHAALRRLWDQQAGRS